MQELINFIHQHILLSLAAVCLFILIIWVEYKRAHRRTFHLTPLEVTQKINKDHAVIIDLREEAAYLQGHIIDSLSLTAEIIKQTPKKIEKFKTRPIIFIDHTGLESQKMAAYLLKQGYNAYALAGGMRAWKEAQMPIIKNSKES